MCNAAPRHSDSLLIVIPNFNDWEALARLLPRIDSVFEQPELRHWSASVLVTDDASTDPRPRAWPCRLLPTLESVSVLQLRSNVGHQRAIASALWRVRLQEDISTVLVMDGDGEERAEDIPAMLSAFELGGRQEAVFGICGRRVRNLSVLPRVALDPLLSRLRSWNHYPAAVREAAIPIRMMPVGRGRRLAGESGSTFLDRWNPFTRPAQDFVPLRDAASLIGTHTHCITRSSLGRLSEILHRSAADARMPETLAVQKVAV